MTILRGTRVLLPGTVVGLEGKADHTTGSTRVPVHHACATTVGETRRGDLPKQKFFVLVRSSSPQQQQQQQQQPVPEIVHFLEQPVVRNRVVVVYSRARKLNLIAAAAIDTCERASAWRRPPARPPGILCFVLHHTVPPVKTATTGKQTKQK